MRYRLLGPLEVVGDDGQLVALAGARERVLLATLVLGANQTVSTDRLVDALWGEDPPATAANALQVHVSKLRKKLSAAGPGESLSSAPQGYVLRTGPGDVDLEEFEQLAGATVGDPAEVATRLRQALGLWRGPALADVSSDLLQGEKTRLEELRLLTLERRVEAELAMERHLELVGELEALVQSAPLREGPRRQLMLALYRSGRQADALATYKAAREVLADELGIDPGPELQALELAILNQDPELVLPSTDEGTGPPSARPSGTVTLLFTDIEGSTRLWEEHSDAMAVALRRHDELLRSIIEAGEGYVFKTVGDAFCAAFPTAKQALEAAAAAQLAISNEPWPEEAVLRVRMALHTGECEERDGDYFGPAPNRVARLGAVAHGGQVVLSRAAADVVRDRLPTGAGLHELGVHHLKDLGRPEEVFQLEFYGLAAEFPPLRSLENPALLNNLPQLVSSFVGRDAEVAEVRKLVTEQRLVTITGAGGSGKTRLALQVAAELVDGSGDGVWLVELAEVNDSEAVAPAVSRALGIQEQQAQGALESLTKAIAELHMLVVLDNCEHVITACAKLADAIVRHCPRVHVLATSREPLGIDGETVRLLAPLSLPPGEPGALGEVAAAGSVALFVERARSQMPEFALSEENAAVVSAICRRLDGMPLALELAAARLRSLSVVDLHDHLDRRFQLLIGGNRSALPRQQTLRGVVDWSYDLLSGPEQLLLGRLSIFWGGFGLTAAEEVCSFGGGEDFDVTVLLASLVDKSLVIADTSTATVRYRLLETIRHYAAERLAELEGADDHRYLRGRHADFYLAYAEEAAPQLTGPEQGTYFARLDADYPNLYNALEFLASTADRHEHALRLTVALRRFWQLCVLVGGELPLLDGVLAQPDPKIPTPLVAKALLCKADLLDRFDLVASINTRNAALDLARENGQANVIADALQDLSFAAYNRGNSQEAVDLANEAVVFARQCRDLVLTGMCVLRLAIGVEAIGDGSTAESLYAEAIDLQEESGDWRWLSISHNDFGCYFSELKRLSEAREHIESALFAAHKIDSEQQIGFASNNLGSILLKGGDPVEAATHLALAARIAWRHGWMSLLSSPELGLACCASSMGELERAATIHGIAQATLDSYGGQWESEEDRDTDLAKLKHALGTSFDHHYEAGRRMGREEGFRFALDGQ